MQLVFTGQGESCKLNEGLPAQVDSGKQLFQLFNILIFHKSPLFYV